MLGAGELLGEGEDRARFGRHPGRDRDRRGTRALRARRVPRPAILAVGAGPRGRGTLGGGRTAGAHYLDLDEPVSEADRGLDRVGQALADVVAHHEPVDHDRDVVLVSLVEHDRLLEHPDPLVDLHAREAVRAQLLEQLAVLALAPAHDRCQHHEARALGQLHHLVDDLLGRLPHDRAPADRAVRLADPRPQQPQVVVDLGHRPDRRAWVARGRLLVDRDRRREPLDRVDVRLVHLPQELARVRRQRLDVPALALGVDRVECEARLARARQARDHDQGVARQLERDVLQIVLARARDDDLVARSHQDRHSMRQLCSQSTYAGFGFTMRNPGSFGPV